MTIIGRRVFTPSLLPWDQRRHAGGRVARL